MNYIDDEYREERGGWSSLLLLSCAECGCDLHRYQKDGPGPLKRCYLPRFVCVEGNAVSSLELPALLRWQCPQCDTGLGSSYLYRDGRWAYDLLEGAVGAEVLHTESASHPLLS